MRLIKLFIFTTLFTACSQTKEEQEAPCIIMDFEQMETYSPFENSDGRLNYELVQLETNESCLIKAIKRVEVDGDFIFVSDINNALFCFQKNDGKFLNHIGRVGAGPEEYLSLADFYIDKEKKEVCVYDPLRTVILKFTYQGKFKGINKYNPYKMGDIKRLQYLNDKSLIATMFNSPTSVYAYRIIDSQEYTTDSELLPFCQTGKVHSSSAYPQVASNNTNCYALSLLSDTIYSYSDDGRMIPAYLFKGHLSHRTDDCWDKSREYETAYDIISQLRLKKISTGIDQLYLIDKFLHFTYYKDETEYKIFWDTENNKGYKSPVSYNGDCIKSMGNYVATTGNAIVSAIDAERYIDLLKKFPQYKEVDINGEEPLLFDNNPLLVFYYINEKSR